MITRFCKWWLGHFIDERYEKGWKDGVEQQFFDPETTRHHTDQFSDDE